MNRTASSNRGRRWHWAWCLTFVVFVTLLFTAPRCAAQALQKGTSVQLAVTHSALAMPDADKEGASIVTVTQTGSVYFGVSPITPAALAERQGLSTGAEEKLYIKADARTPYSYVAKVLDTVHKAGVKAPNLLTTQHETPAPGKLVSPKGLEVLVGPPSPFAHGSTVVQVSLGQQRPLLKINNQEVPWLNLESKLRQLLKTQDSKPVLLHADGKLSFGDVVRVIDVCHSTGAKVFLVTPAT
jgi:biopolymer transport protein ExbD